MPSPQATISACILARNEETRLPDALQSLQGWTKQLIVIDNESEDNTVEIARRYGADILTAPRSTNFDALRNLAIDVAKGEWIFYLDADERVPEALGQELQRLVQERGDQFEALCIPFKHYFCGKWMEHSGWWPGYTRPQLLKKGRFRYNERLHSGVSVDGHTLYFPADNPDYAIVHYSYDDLTHYLTKLNHYTDGEAESLIADHQSHTWQAQLAHFVHDWQVYYERGRADLDGMHGFILAFLSGAYRFLSRAKLWDLRRQKGELIGNDPAPASVQEMLVFMARVAQEGAAPWLAASPLYSHFKGDRVPQDWLSVQASESDAGTKTARSRKKEHSGIAACIVARNEERRIEMALQSLQGWTDRIIVVDNESEDTTTAIARRYTPHVLSAPRAANLDEVRLNAAPEIEALAFEECEWLLYLDADERVPSCLGQALKRLVKERGHEFEALCLPFRNYFYGKWMQGSTWWPGYKGPQLVKKGTYRYGEHLHSGMHSQGRILYFPSQDSELAVRHEAYDTIAHYLTQLNADTSAQAEIFDTHRESHTWQAQLAHFVHDWKDHYDEGNAQVDGMHGFIQAFLCSLNSFVVRAKLWDTRRKRGETHPQEPVPATLQEMLTFMARVLQEGADTWLSVRHQPVSARSLQAGDPVLRVPLLWQGPLFDPSGYAEDGRNLVLACIEAGEPLALVPQQWGGSDAGIPSQERALLERCLAPADTPADLLVSNTLPRLLQPAPHALFHIARTVFETDRLPQGWAQWLNAVDRLWVPSEYNRELFARSGVDAHKIAVIPEAVAPHFFTPVEEPWPLPARYPFTFLSVFDWMLHKGWDVLLEAFAHAFGGNTDVGLILKTWSSNGYSREAIREQADALLQARLNKRLEAFPNIHLWQEIIPASEMPRLYRAADCFVLSTRGEGWCRPLMEAMAVGLPTIATNWSGHTTYHDATVGYPLRFSLKPVSAAGGREVPFYAGHNWAEPDVAHLQRLLRSVVNNPETARKKGQAARKRIQERYSRAAVAPLLQEEMALCREQLQQKRAMPRPETVAHVASPKPEVPRALPQWPKANPVSLDPVAEVDFRTALGRPLRLRWEGHQFIRSSLALVNREFCLGLLARADIELSLVTETNPWHTLTPQDDPRFQALLARWNVPLSGPPDVVVRHHFPPRWTRPEEGKLIVIQPWELSHLPEQDWIEGATQHADEVWAYSRFVRDVYVRSGVPAEKVRVVPLGVRTEVFTPEGIAALPVRCIAALPPQALEKFRRARTRFLYVGGTTDRKGADLLLQAYLQAFTDQEDVCLVVKDMGTRTFYRGENLGEAFQRLQAHPQAPGVIYCEDDLNEEELASLYRACTCVVLPYRGEGFGLSPLEGMACGRPAIVTSGGSTDDYLDDAHALRVPHYRQLRPGFYKGPNASGFDPWHLEPDRHALTDAFRWVHEHPDGTAARGKAARAHVESGWTWERAVKIACARLMDIVVPNTPRSQTPARVWSEPPGTKRGKKAGSAKPIELSLCMIARNEEPRLASALNSIAPYVDEMIVVDTGSTDRTREVARDCGARVFDFPWTDSFAEARNQSIDQARGRWIFWMDADDVISAECGAKLRALIQRHPEADAAYQVQVSIPPGPGEFSASVVDHVKLFPNRPDVRFEHRIHEQVLPALRRAGIPILFSDLYVTHAHYDRSEAGQARKRQRDFHLLELDLRDYPNHPFVLFNLGMTYLYATKEFEVAAHYLRRSLAGSDWRDSIVRKAYALLTTARVCQQDWKAAVEANTEGRSYYAEDAELLFQAGQIYQQVGKFDEARRTLERLVAGQDDPHYRSVDVGLRTYRGWHELALLFRRLGDAPHCAEVLHRIVAAHPEYLPAKKDLVETLQDLTGQSPSREVLRTSPADQPGSLQPPAKSHIEVVIRAGKKAEGGREAV